MIVYGARPVLEALRAGRVRRLMVTGGARSRLHDVLRLAEAAGVGAQHVEPEALDRLAGGGAHQGVAAEVTPGRDYTIDELVTETGEPALIVVLDGIEDPQNLGAILRTADAAGAHGVVRQTRHAAPAGAAAAKASAGAIAHVRMAPVVNIARALDELKAAGVWTVGLAGRAETRYDDVDLTLPTAIVVGAEGTGLRRLVRERCDWLVSIPMGGQVESLNVSVAAGIALFEARRQRRRARASGSGPSKRG
jgi:23S rRNA (guanosine2251-2'-O)-methyltransferase